MVDGGTRAALVEGGELVLLAPSDVGELLACDDWGRTGSGELRTMVAK